MGENLAQTSNSIPSKTFLMGEYAVLFGGRALVLTHAPYFGVIEEQTKSLFHEDSPAGKLLKENKKKQTFSFLDPYGGAGGFGGSTAEFIAAYQNIFGVIEGRAQEDLLNKYFECFQEVKNPPSGADLLAQSFLRTGVVEYKKESSFKIYEWPFDGVEILIFKTREKVKTHEHLSDLSVENLERLKDISETAVDMFKNKDEEDFFKFVDEFTKEQALQGLLHLDTMALICQVNQIKGVHTSRGCGAMGADVFMVFVKSGAREYVLKQILGLDMGLNFVTNC